MNHFKPLNRYRKLDACEMYLELLFIFSLFCALTYFVPLFIALRTSASSYFSFLLDFLDTNKMAHYYPYIGGVAMLVTVVYAWIQGRDRRVVEIVNGEDEMEIRSLNRFTGRVHERRVLKMGLRAKRSRIGSFVSAEIKIYDGKRYVASFCPFASPWNRQKDRVTIMRMNELLEPYLGEMRG